jgi:ferric-dicitrate binding protein FerR (iron transport regulator)
LRERHAATLEATLQRNAIIQEEARQQYQSAAEAKRQARQQASAALDVPIVAYDRYGNPHVTTRRNQGLAAVLTVAFMIGAFVWIYHGGFMHQDCTTTLTTTGGINDSTMHDVTTCK